MSNLRLLVATVLVLGATVPFGVHASSAPSVSIQAKTTSIVPNGGTVRVEWEGSDVKECSLYYPGKKAGVMVSVKVRGEKKLRVYPSTFVSPYIGINCLSKSTNEPVSALLPIALPTASNEVTLKLLVPKEVVVGQEYTIRWGNNPDKGSLEERLKSFPNLEGELAVYEKSNTGFTVQTIKEHMTVKEIKKKKGKWTVGSLGNDGSTLSAGTYYMVLVLQTPVDANGESATLAQGVSKDFSVTY